MNKTLKLTLVVLGILIGIILLDTLQARIFKHSPIISFKEELEDEDSWVDRGILIDTYYCTKDSDIVTVSWHFKTEKFTCPIDMVNDEEIKMESLVNDDGLIFSIRTGNKDCVPVQLSVYENGKYEFYNTYKYPKDAENINLKLTYSDPVIGTYDYDVLKIIKASVDAEDKSYDMSNLPEYEIYTGQGRYYTVEKGTKNKYLDEFLKQIRIDLNVCAEKDYY